MTKTDDLEFTLPDRTFAEVATAKNLRVLIYNESQNATLSCDATGFTSKANQFRWPTKRSWQGDRFV